MARRQSATPPENTSCSRQNTPGALITTPPDSSSGNNTRLQHTKDMVSSEPIPRSPSVKRKRSLQGPIAEPTEVEGIHPFKKPRPSKDHDPHIPPKVTEQESLPSLYPLSRKNLQKLNEENMADSASSARSLKRTASSRSLADLNTNTSTQRSYNTTNLSYRNNILKRFEIYIHATPNDSIRAEIDRIINAEVLSGRLLELHSIAQEFHKGSLKLATDPGCEEDFTDPIRTVLKDLRLKNLSRYEKGEWQIELKPVAPPRNRFRPRTMHLQQSITESHMPPSAAPLSQPAYPPEGSTMPPPPVPPSSLIKTPRPDIYLGIEHTSIIRALSSRNLTEVDAQQFLEFAQTELGLIAVPSTLSPGLAFPFCVVEAKAYATGKQLFEAENQASVSAACGLKIQLDLDTLVQEESGTGPSFLPKAPPPLFFSICTQGPVHELWAHWTEVKEDVRSFQSKLLDSCNALLLEQGEVFIVKLNNIGSWGVGAFMDSVVERLEFVADNRKA